MDIKKEYLKQIAQDMVEHLSTMPDNTSICTREMLALIGGPELSDADLFDVDDFFFQEAEKNGFIVDMSEHTGLAEGLPYNLDATFRNRKALLSKFASLPEKEVVTSDGGRYYIKEFAETYVGDEDDEGKSFTEERLLQLYILLSAKHSNPHPNSLRYNSWDEGKSMTSPPLSHFLFPLVAIQPPLQA